MWLLKNSYLLFFIIVLPNTHSKLNITLVIILESQSSKELNWVTNAVEKTIDKTQQILNTNILYIYDNVSMNSIELCSKLPSTQLSIVFDVSWHGLKTAGETCNFFGIPYVHFHTSLIPILKALKRYIEIVYSKNVVLFFEDEKEPFQSYNFFFGKSEIRIINVLSLNSTRILPEASHYVIFAHSNNITALFTKIKPLITYIKPEKWILILEDYGNLENIKMLLPKMTVFQIDIAMCCLVKYMQTDCDCIDENEYFRQDITETFFSTIADILLHFSAMYSTELKSITLGCSDLKKPASNRKMSYLFSKMLDEYFSKPGVLAYDIKNFDIHFSVEINILQINENLKPTLIKKWKSSSGMIDVNHMYLFRPFLRIGVIMKEPWYYLVKDPTNDNTEIETGYSVDLIKKLAEMMLFDYEIIRFSEFDYGKFVNGSWSGIIGNLSEKYLDMVVTDLAMTRDLEKVIDFITPSFHQIGSLMLKRVIVSNHSLFEFSVVLKPAVWVAILFGLVISSISIWLLDKYSPYSARNKRLSNKSPTRIFTLPESFWFTMTSLTPQGGGEPPQALSSRLLVVIFWIFSVLVLTTFTANFASFLTTEKKSLKLNTIDEVLLQEEVQLIGVNNSYTLQHFKKSSDAESTIFELWRNKTLKEMDNRKKYRIWKYPTIDRFNSMLGEMKRYNLSKNFSDAVQRLLDDIKGEYILVHDADEVQYATKLDCNLITLGSMFARAPVALAVQKESLFTNNLTEIISILHEEKFFSSLRKKYWNSGKNINCIDRELASDEYSVGFKNFGGIFIIAGVIYLFAIIFLIWEIRTNKIDKKVKNIY